MITDDILDPQEPRMFLGYRNPGNDMLPDVYQTITHWFESEKFRGVDETLRVEILNAPTCKEAVKIAKRKVEIIPASWKLLSARVMRAGLAMSAQQNPEVMERIRKLAMLTPLDVEIAFNPGAQIHGYPAKWYCGIQVEMAHAMVSKPQILAIAGISSTSYEAKKSLIDKHANPATLSMMIVPIARNASAVGEEWAIAHRAPLHYAFAPKGKLDPEFLKSLATLANKFLVFERKNGSLFDPLIAHAKSMGRTVTLTLV